MVPNYFHFPFFPWCRILSAMTLIACEAELHGSVPRMVSSILSLIGKYAHLNLRVTRCEYHSETKRLPDLLRTNFCWECQCSEKATFHCKTCCKGLCYLHGQITPSALEIFSREGADGCRTCIGLKDFQKTRSEAAQALLAQLVGRLDISVFWFAVSVFWFAVSVFWFAVFVCLPQNISRC